MKVKMKMKMKAERRTSRSMWANTAPLMLVLALAARADTPPVAACADEKSTFAGPSRTSTAMITGEDDSRLYFHPVHPSKCASPDSGSCKGRAYVLAGDEVTVGNSCGAWSYVRFKAGDSTTIGWVESARLQSLPGKAQDVNATYHFRLDKGKETPVCDSYLQQLNATTFERPPYCGRPEPDSADGFVHLHRIQLTHDEILALVGHVSGFVELRNQDDHYHLFARKIDDHGVVTEVPAWNLKNITDAPDLEVWRYEPQVDIDNDGRPDNVVIWHGAGADTSNNVCGSMYPNQPGGGYVRQLAFILTPDGHRIDEKRTEEIFGQPATKGAGKDRAWPGKRGFHEYGTYTGIFSFQGKYYFDSFTDDPDSVATGTKDNGRWVTHLGVFKREQGQTAEMCRLQYGPR